MTSYISSEAIYSGEVTHTIDVSAQRMIRDASGNSLLLRADTISFSANGDWMVVDSPLYGTLRINTKTYEVLPFGERFNYSSGTGVNLQTSITNDGRFAAIASNGHTRFRIYDLVTCGDAPIHITGHVNCKYRDLYREVISEFHDFSGLNSLMFLNENTLQTFISTGSGSKKVTKRVLISPQGSAPNDTYEYLGLGDSFSSGEGAYEYKAFTDSDENYCHVSLVSYPYLIGQGLGFNNYESVACSGAETNDVKSLQEQYGDPQAKNKNSDDFDNEILRNFMPGYRPQRFFSFNIEPEVITLSIGGNDMGFGSILFNCLMPGTCYDTYEDRELLLQTVDKQFNKLVDTYNTIKSSSPESRIYVLGYPSLVNEEGDCDINVRLNRTELKMANDLVNYLNRTIEQATKKAGVYYVDVENAFVGYRLCEQGQQWHMAVNGLTAGDDKRVPHLAGFNNFAGPIANESFHPNQRGHELYKSVALNQTNNLTAPIPSADPSVIRQPNHTDEPLLKDYKKPDFIREVFYTPALLPANVLANEVLHIQTPLNQVNFLAGSSVEVWLHSTPTRLGTFTTGNDGSFTANISLPDTIEPGYHTLHILGTNSSGEKVDIYDYVYIAQNHDDWDGDGIISEDEECYFGEPAGRDLDQDGVDDACDGFISEPPTPEVKSSSNTALDNTGTDSNQTNTTPEFKPATNNPDSILLATAAGSAQTDTAESKNTANKTQVLGKRDDTKDTRESLKHAAKVIKSDMQPFIVLAVLLAAAAGGGWLLIRKA